MYETITYIQRVLAPLYPPEEIRSLTGLILEKCCNLSRSRQIFCKDRQLSALQKKSVHAIVERLKNAEPIQYVFGETEFYGLTFEVTPAVLIPRPETEELVHRIIQDMKRLKHDKISMLDIGTGSGCIAVALAKNIPSANVYALDISEDALVVAKKNAQKNVVNVRFLQADIFSHDIDNLSQLPNFDLIVSNPPYVTVSEKASLHPNVLNYEPQTALFVPDNDPIIFYLRIASFSLNKLNLNGLMYFEINAAFSDTISRMLAQQGYREIETIHDLSGKERFIKARK
ncbi:MAG: peptide chain release factor N(5)-glutamine methyltransferase [Tannerella sp.]|jgi:release factor glutamine methyltransferase|nr:peptide chain release factor N(5)-glutamine methyltransferase [Tannerella sp.]